MIQRCIDAPDSLRFDIFYALSDNRWGYRDVEHAPVPHGSEQIAHHLLHARFGLGREVTFDVAAPESLAEQEVIGFAEEQQRIGLVLLDLLPRAPAVALLAPAQVGIDRLPVEHESRRKPADDRDERGTVRLARGDELERHQDEAYCAARVA